MSVKWKLLGYDYIVLEPYISILSSVSELVLNDQTCTMTSLLRKQCHRGDSIILGIWLKDNDHQTVEEQLQPNSAAGSGAVEHDSSCVFMEKDSSNWPLPLGVMVVDSAVRLFGKVFPSLGDKHKLQLLSHFNDTIKNGTSFIVIVKMIYKVFISFVCLFLQIIYYFVLTPILPS